MNSLISKYKGIFVRLASVASSIFRLRRFSVLKLFFLVLEFPIELFGDIIFSYKRIFQRTFINPHKILIVRVDRMGDVLFSTSLVLAIKEVYPHCQIDYIVHPQSRDVLLKNPHVSNIFSWVDPVFQVVSSREYKTTSFFNVFVSAIGAIKVLRGNKYDYIINGRALTPSSNFWWFLVRAKRLISFDISEQSFLSDFWARYDLKSEEWENYNNLLLPLGIKRNIPGIPLFFNFNNTVFDSVKLRILKNKRYFVCSPVSFDSDKQWNIYYWGEILRFCVSAGNMIVLTGTPNQKLYLEQIKNFIQDPDDIVVVTDIPLADLASLYQKSSGFLGVESFPAHLALALNKHIFCGMNYAAYYLKGMSHLFSSLSARSMLTRGSLVHTFSIYDSAGPVILLLEKSGMIR
ncbi:MAG: glycosyltransferase family 9 protein [Patescibacteria group bacterium]|nr:glycosyltransferase family 9 protein [Patescibacteria group bacterium]